MLNPISGGESITSFNFIPTTSNCQYDAVATTNIYLPRFNSACFTEMYNPNNLALADISQAKHGLAAQLNLQTSESAGRTYFLGSHPGIFQFGFWFSNAHKFDDSYENDYMSSGTVLASQFLNDFRNNNYYGGSYPFGPGISWSKANAYLAANPSAFTMTTTYGGNTNNFDLIERVIAGYLMNTLDFGRVSVIAGVRFEGTRDDTLSFDTALPVPCLCAKGHASYVSVLPSASVQIRLDNSSDIRLAYARGISRPDPQFLTAATTVDTSTFPPTVSLKRRSRSSSRPAWISSTRTSILPTPRSTPKPRNSMVLGAP
jgi:hypothetical protein